MTVSATSDLGIGQESLSRIGIKFYIKCMYPLSLSMGLEWGEGVEAKLL